jgi:hypothetical protein
VNELIQSSRWMDATVALASFRTNLASRWWPDEGNHRAHWNTNVNKWSSNVCAN